MKKSKIEGRTVFAISDFSDRALVERTRRAARSGKGTLLSLVGPHPNSDVSISRHENGDLKLEKSKFNSQRRHLEKGSPVRDWDGGPFHLGSEIVLAAWVCGEMDAESLVFVGELATPTPLVSDALSKIIEEYGLPLSFTHSSRLVEDLNEADIEPNLKSDDVTYPYRVEPLNRVFANKFSDSVFQDASSVEIVRDERNSSSDADITVRWGEGRYGKDADLRFISSVSKNLLEIPSTRVVLLGRDVESCVKICEDYHSIYLPSEEVRKQLSRIQRSELSEVGNLNLATQTVLIVSMASSYETFKTFGVLDEVGSRERQFLKRIECVSHA